jgi:hypothetical protein
VKQQEKPGITPEQLCANLGLPTDTPCMVSGGQFENFRKGWAHNIMGASPSKVAHWFVRNGFDGAESLCGVFVAVRWVYGPGNYPKCAHCIRIMSRRIKSGIDV